VSIFYLKMSELYEAVVQYYNTNTDKLENETGGKIRSGRGNTVEGIMDIIGKSLNFDCRVGTSDKQRITIVSNGREYSQEHQVDRHLYFDNRLVAIVECKAYLDSCYYVRACSDFKRMKKRYPHIKAYVFALENSISDEAVAFTDVDYDNSCDGIFYMCNGKRSSSKPIYKKEFAKTIQQEHLSSFVQQLRTLLD